MAKINLKRVISKKDASSIINAFINHMDDFGNIRNLNGEILIGKEGGSVANKCPILANDETIGWVYGGESSSLLALIISNFVNNHILNKALGSEALDCYDELILMQEVSEKLTTEYNPEKVRNIIIGQTKEMFNPDSVSIMFMNSNTGLLEIVASFGMEYDKKVVMHANEGIAGNIIVSGKAEIINDARSDARFIPGSNEIHSLMCAPLKTKNNIIGVVNVSSNNPTDYTAANLKMFTTLASQGAVAIENAQYTEELRKHKDNLEEMVKERTKELNDALKELATANKTLKQLSSLDGLTGVSNRRHFDELAKLEWKRALRDKLSLSLVMVDVDFFKNYNDTYGHQAGDDCLIKVANALKSVITRETDTIARYGGEEFVAVLPNTDIRGAIALGDEMRAKVESLGLVHAKSDVYKRVTISVGVAAMTPDKNSSLQELLANADKALYKAKHKGRNQVCC